MKNIQSLAVLFLIAFAVMSCVSVVEVTDSWQGEKISDLSSEKFLVINKTNNKESRERFENDLSEQLRSKGINAVQSYKAFPDLTPKKRSPEEIEEVKKIIIDAGYRGVVVSGLKNVVEKYQSSTTGGYDKEVTTGEGMGITILNYNYHYYGFGSFYGSMYNSNLGSIYVEPETTTNSYNVYTLEAVTYDLSLSEKQQIVGVISVKVTDPASYEEIAGKYARIITKQFK